MSFNKTHRLVLAKKKGAFIVADDDPRDVLAYDPHPHRQSGWRMWVSLDGLRRYDSHEVHAEWDEVEHP